MVKNPDNIGYHMWITNMTKTDIMISDLGICVKSRSTVDLLDCRHSLLSVDKVRKSMKSGSLGKRLKQKKLVIRHSAPPTKNPNKIDLSQASFPSRQRSTVSPEVKVFEELELISTKEEEERYANEMAECALEDHSPSIQITKEEK